MSFVGNGLERLQSLDDLSNVDLRIATIHEVLGLRPSLSSIFDGSSARVGSERRGLAAFALKWLLEQLRQSKPTRCSPSAWHLLATLVASLPSTASSRSLASAQYFSLLDTALEESWPHRMPAKEEALHSGAASKSSKKRGQHGGGGASRSGLNGGAASSAPEASGEKDAEAAGQLFAAMASGLDSMSQPQKRGRDGSGKARGILPPLDGDQACRLLGSWMNALSCLCDTSTSVSNSPQVADYGVAPVVRIWEAGAAAAADEGLLLVSAVTGWNPRAELTRRRSNSQSNASSLPRRFCCQVTSHATAPEKRPAETPA